MIINRVWAMVNKNTFECKPLGLIVKRYLANSQSSVDPFAGNNAWATYTNDLSSSSPAHHHMEARIFLDALIGQDIKVDLAIIDPPYSQVQVMYVYKGIGREYKPFGDDNNAVLYRQVRDKIDHLMLPNGIVMSFGWNSAGMGIKRGYKIEKILLVCHGGAHNDTIVTVERKGSHNP